MDKNATGIIAYFTIVGWVIAFILGDKEGAKFHLNQALTLALAEIVVAAVCKFVGFIPFLGWAIRAVCGLVLLVCWIYGLVTAIKGEEKEIPVLGQIRILN